MARPTPRLSTLSARWVAHHGTTRIDLDLHIV
jgi:hypothetical protein